MCFENVVHRAVGVSVLAIEVSQFPFRFTLRNRPDIRHANSPFFATENRLVLHHHNHRVNESFDDIATASKSHDSLIADRQIEYKFGWRAPLPA